MHRVRAAERQPFETIVAVTDDGLHRELFSGSCFAYRRFVRFNKMR